MSFPFPNDPGVTYTEHIEATRGPEEHFTHEGASAVRYLDVSWPTRFRAIRAILGAAVALPNIGNLIPLGRKPPLPYPGAVNALGNYYLFATRVDTMPIKPTGLVSDDGGSGGGGIGLGLLFNTVDPVVRIASKNRTSNIFMGLGLPFATYQIARLKITYETLPYEVLADEKLMSLALRRLTQSAYPDESGLARYVSRRVSPAGEILPVPTGVFKWVKAGTPAIEIGVPKLMISFNLAITWHEIPQQLVPCSSINTTLASGTGVIETTLGKMNDSYFNGWPMGSLLLVACELKPQRNLFGVRIWQITYFFKHLLPVSGFTHTHLFDPRTPGWVEASTDGATNLITQAVGKSIYDYASYRSLFFGQTGPQAYEY